MNDAVRRGATDSVPPTRHEFERVRELLGRTPQGAFEVVVRDDAGDPVVLRNAPLLDDGTPMPTRYWLVGRVAVVAVSPLGAAGGGRTAGATIDPAGSAGAHRPHAAAREAGPPPHPTRPPPASGGRRA